MQTFVDYAAYIIPWFLVLLAIMRATSEVLFKAAEIMHNQKLSAFATKMAPYIELGAKIAGYFGAGVPKGAKKLEGN